jgi:hypothetical protein
MIHTFLQRLAQLIRPERAQELAKKHGWFKRRAKISAFEFLYSTLARLRGFDLRAKKVIFAIC